MSLVVQWLGFSTFTVVTLGSIPGWGTKITHVEQPTRKKKKKKRVRSRLRKDLC